MSSWNSPSSLSNSDDILVDRLREILVASPPAPSPDAHPQLLLSNPAVDHYSPLSDTTELPTNEDIEVPGESPKEDEDWKLKDEEDLQVLSNFVLKPTYACMQCRARKSRCSKEFPSCANCVMRGDTCVFDRLPNVVPTNSTSLPQPIRASPFSPQSRVGEEQKRPARDGMGSLKNDLSTLGKEVDELVMKYEATTGDGVTMGMGDGSGGGGVGSQADVKGKQRDLEFERLLASYADVLNPPIASGSSSFGTPTPFQAPSPQLNPAFNFLPQSLPSPAIFPPSFNPYAPSALFGPPMMQPPVFATQPLAGPSHSQALLAHQQYQQALAASNPFHPAYPMHSLQAMVEHPHPQALLQHHAQYQHYRELMSRLPWELQLQGLPRGVAGLSGSVQPQSRKRKRPANPVRKEGAGSARKGRRR